MWSVVQAHRQTHLHCRRGREADSGRVEQRHVQSEVAALQRLNTLARHRRREQTVYDEPDEASNTAG